MGTSRARRSRVIPAAAAAAVAACTLAGSFSGMGLERFVDGGLGLAFGDAAVPTGVVQQGAVEAVLLLARGLALAVAGVAALTVAVLTLADAARRTAEAATRTALGATPAGIAAWAVRHRLRGTGPWLAVGAAVGLAFGGLARSLWPGRVETLIPLSAIRWAGLGSVALVLLMVVLTLVPLATVGQDLRGKMGSGSAVLSRYPTGLRWVLPIVQLSITGGLLAVSTLLIASGHGSDPGPGSTPDDVQVSSLRLDGDAEERAAALRRAVDGGPSAASDRAGAATPGAFVGLGIRDQAMAECGRCYVGLMLVPLQGAEVRHHAVYPDTFRALGIRVVEGREFRPTDAQGAHPVAMVNRAFARASFHDGGPLGKHVRIGTDLDAWYEVVGVVEGERLGQAPGGYDSPAVYVSALQHPPRDVELFVPTPAGFGAGDESLRAYLLRHAAPLRWTGRMMAALGFGALALSLTGLVAVMAFIATRRRRELALRATMGARRADLLKQLVGEGARIVSAGLVGAAWATTMVFGLSATLADGLQRGLLGAALGMLALLCVAGLVGSALVARSVSMLSPREVLSET